MSIYGSNYSFGDSPIYKDEGYSPPAVMDFGFFPNWVNGLVVRYSFETNVFTSKSYAEQRSGLRTYPYREIMISVFEDSLESSRIINTLIHLIQQDIVIPIYTEPFRCVEVGDLFGLDTITSAEITCLYNLQVANQNGKPPGGIVIRDINGIIDTMVANIKSVGLTTVEFYGGLPEHFMAETTMFYPTLACYLESYQEMHDSHGLSTFNFTFRERRSWEIHVLD
jgi:hypothetical protein